MDKRITIGFWAIDVLLFAGPFVMPGVIPVEVAWIAVALAIGMLSYALFPRWLLRLLGINPRQPEAMAMGDTYNNSGKNFGHMGPINNYGKQPFQLTQGVVDQVVAAIPTGSDVVVMAVGTQRAFPMRDTIGAALGANGCKVELDSAMTFMPKPEHPITVTENYGKPLILVAPDA